MFPAAPLEALKSWSDFGTLIGGIAAAVGVFIASAAAGFAWGQITAGKQAQRESFARQTYANYLQLAIQYPAYASGGQPGDEEAFEQYEWFVSYMLNACEHVLLFVSGSEDWRACVRSQLSYHRDYLCKNEWFRQSACSHYSADLLSLIHDLCGTTE
jgi:hypothetical protein